jgi:outer membrane protein assembly factor BamB
MMRAAVRRWARFPFRRSFWPVIAVVGVLSSLMAALGSSGMASGQASADWPGFMLNTTHTSYSAAATSITPSNVADLQPVWRWIVPASPNAGPSSLYATPVSVGGVLYIGADDGEFYAVDEATQKILWSRFLGLITPTTCKSTWGIRSSAEVATDPSTGSLAVYVNAPDGYLYALNPATGAVLWREVVAIPSTTVNNYYSWGSPMVTNGNVYVGVSSNCGSPESEGGVLGFNAGTGTELGRWHSIPGQTGGSVWSTPTAGDNGSIIVDTGNSPSMTLPPPLHADSINKIDGSSIKLINTFQPPASALGTDDDFGATATAFTATLNGVRTRMVGACDKNGVYYALREDNLSEGAVWQQTINKPYTGAGGVCVAGSIWDGTRIIAAAGDQATIHGTTYQGGVYAFNPATGTPLWETGLPGEVVGSPAEDGAGVVAVAIWGSTTNNYGVYLLSASTGAILRYIPLGQNRIFGQPVFAGNYLLVDGLNTSVGVTAYQVTTPGSPITAVSPGKLTAGSTETLTLTGSGFSGTPSVFVSDTNVTVNSVKVVSPTKLSVSVTAAASADIGPRGITVIEPGPTADTCTSCLNVTSTPTVTAVSPKAVGQQAARYLTLTGTGFTPSTKVSFSAAGITASSLEYLSPTSVQVWTTVTGAAPAGTSDVTVTTPDGTATCSACLTIDPHATIKKISPTSIAAGASATISVTGANFVSGLTVSTTIPGATVGTPASVTSTSLSVTVTVPAGVTAGNYVLKVINPDGGTGSVTLPVT